MEDTQSPEQRFAERMRNRRGSRNWSQSEVAKRMAAHGFNWRQTTVAKVENGERPIRLDEAVALAHIFHSHVTDMVKEDPLGVLVAHERALVRAVEASEAYRESVTAATMAQAAKDRADAAAKEAERIRREAARQGFTGAKEVDLEAARKEVYERYIGLGGDPDSFGWLPHPASIDLLDKREEGDDGQHQEAPER